MKLLPNYTVHDVVTFLCPRCYGTRQLIATLPIKEGYEKRLETLLTAITRRDWHLIFRFDEWEPLLDDYETYAIKCEKEIICIVILISYYEPFYRDDVIKVECLDYEDSQYFLKLPNQSEWKQVDKKNPHLQLKCFI
jgi:hypothetical protein